MKRRHKKQMLLTIAAASAAATMIACSSDGGLPGVAPITQGDAGDAATDAETVFDASHPPGVAVMGDSGHPIVGVAPLTDAGEDQ
jgi:hypothetical protein